MQSPGKKKETGEITTEEGKCNTQSQGIRRIDE